MTYKDKNSKFGDFIIGFRPEIHFFVSFHSPQGLEIVKNFVNKPGNVEPKSKKNKVRPKETAYAVVYFYNDLKIKPTISILDEDAKNYTNYTIKNESLAERELIPEKYLHNYLLWKENLL